MQKNKECEATVFCLIVDAISVLCGSDYVKSVCVQESRMLLLERTSLRTMVNTQKLTETTVDQKSFLATCH